MPADTAVDLLEDKGETMMAHRRRREVEIENENLREMQA
jgi:hypothetical protein